MFKKYSIVLILSCLSILPAADTLFHEDFSAGTTDSLTILSGTWQAQGAADKYLIQMDLGYTGYRTVLFGPDSLTGFTLTARFRPQAFGGVAFHFGCGDARADSSWQVRFLRTDSTYMLRDPAGTVVMETAVPMEINRWYPVRITYGGRILEAVLDDSVRLTYLMPVSVTGRLGISGIDGMRVLFDDLLVTEAGSLAYHAPRFISVPSDFADKSYTGTLYTDTLYAVDADSGDSILYSLVPGPQTAAGSLSVHPETGAIRWIPALADTSITALTFRVVDQLGLDDTLSIPMEVIHLNQAPLFTTGPGMITDTAYVNAVYRDTLAAADPDSDNLVFARLSGPAGLYCDAATGVIAWVPSAADTGADTVEMTVSDPGGLSDTLRFFLYVAETPVSNVPPVFVSAPGSLLSRAVEGIAYRDTLRALDANGDALTYYLGPGRPDSMMIDDSTGVLSWTPVRSDTGLHTITAGVRDPSGAADSLQFIIMVFAARPAWCECSAHAPVMEWYRIYDTPDEREARGLARGTAGGYVVAGGSPAAEDGIQVLGTGYRGDSLWNNDFTVDRYGFGGDVVRAADSGYAVAGTGGDDFYLVKLRPGGQTLWSRRYETAAEDRCHDITRAPDGGYLLAGEVKSPVNGDWDARLIRTDAAGDTLWTRTLGGLNNDNAHAADVTFDNGFIVTGATRSFSQEGFDLWLIRLDSLGQTLWTKTFDGPAVSSFEYGYDIRQTADLGFIAAGRTSSPGGAESYGWLVKTDRNGDSLWSKTFAAGSGEELLAVRQTADGGYVIAGYTDNGADGEDARLIVLDPNGDPVWDCTMGGGLDDRGLDVVQAADGGLVMTGYTASFGGADRDVWLMKFAAQEDPVLASSVNLVADSVAGTDGLLTGLVTVHYSFDDTAGLACRVGELFYSAGDSVSWNRAGLNTAYNNPYRTAGSHSFRFNTAAYLDSVYTDPLYLRFCLADTAGSGDWEEIDTIPEARSRFAAAVIGTRIYTAGGFIPGTGYTGRLSVYDALRGVWRDKAPMPTARDRLGAAVVDGRVYALGGWTGSGTVTGAVEVYDPLTNTWEGRSPMPTPRFAFGTAAIGGKIYTVGGFSTAGDYEDKVEIYDPVTDTWTNGSPLPEARYAPAVGVARDKIYVFGGYNTFTGGFFNEVLEYDPAAGSWAVRGLLSSGRHSLQAVTVNGRILLVGGWDAAAGELDAVEEFDPESFTWRRRPSLNHARKLPALAAVAGRVFAFSGVNGGLTVNSLEKYTASVYSNYVITEALRVDNNLQPVYFATHPDSIADTAYEDRTFTDTLKAFTPLGDTVLYFTFLRAPGSARIDTASGIISWLPVAADTGTRLFRVRVSDRRQLVADTLSFTVTVMPVNDYPVIDSLSVPAGPVTEGDTVMLRVFASDEENDSLGYRWVAGDTLPFGGTPLVYTVPYTAAPADTLFLTVLDHNGGSVQDTIVLTVRNTALPPRLLVSAGDTIYPGDTIAWGWDDGRRDPDLDTGSTMFILTVYRDSSLTDTVVTLDTVLVRDSLGTGFMTVDSLLDPLAVGPGRLWWVAAAFDADGYRTGTGDTVEIFYYNRQYLAGHFPPSFSLSVPRPNPFYTRVRIDLEIPPVRTATLGNWRQLEGQTRKVRVSVYSAYGMRVRRLMTGNRSAGRYLLEWDGSDDRNKGTPGGIYFITAVMGDTVLTRRVIRSQNSPY